MPRDHDSTTAATVTAASQSLGQGYGEMAGALRGLRTRLERIEQMATAGLGLSISVLIALVAL